MDDVLSIVLAGGQGSRLMPLTRDRAKPAVPFGGRYRIIDFVLSNLVNSGFHKVKIITQYKSQSLNRHLARGWRLSPMLDQYIELVPAQQRRGPRWFQGSADAIYQSLNVITDENPSHVAVFSGDHIYRMDVRQFMRHHIEHDADLTVAAIPIPLQEASAFGVIESNAAGQMTGFQEKPKTPTPMHSDPSKALGSMGIYIFKTKPLIEEICRDAANEDSAHDFGKSIVTSMYRTHNVQVYDFLSNIVPGQSTREHGYWRDVGTLESYYQAHMDLISLTPVIDLYNRRWPIRTHYEHNPPAKFVHDDVVSKRVGAAINSVVSDGCIISGSRIKRSVLFQRVRANSYSNIKDSILFEGVDVGRHVKLRKTIVDKDVKIPAHEVVGYDLEYDRQRFHVSPTGIVVIPKDYVFTPRTT